MKLSRLLLAGVVVAGLATAAYASGLFPGFPVVTSPTGDETFPADTNSTHGDQTVLISLDTVKAFANDVTDGQTANARAFNTGGQPPMLSTDGNNSTPVITEFYYSEIVVPFNVTLTGVAVFNGTDVTGNVKVGLADSTGAIVATSASTAGAGTDAYQRVPFTATKAITPGVYYVLTFYDSGTARYNTHIFGNFSAGKVTGQVFATGFTAFTPATTFTTALGSMASLY